MSFIKHNVKTCPRCSCHGAYFKKSNIKTELICYFCGYSKINELNESKENIKKEKKPLYVVFYQKEDYDSYFSSDLEWFINEYLINDDIYLDLSKYTINYIYEEKSMEDLIKLINKDDYHYLTRFNKETNELFLISCGKVIENKIDILKKIKRT